MADQLAPGRPCPFCAPWGWARRIFKSCLACQDHGRMPYEVDLRGKGGFPAHMTEIPYDFDIKYDNFLTDPPDNRSPMIKMLNQRENP